MQPFPSIAFQPQLQAALEHLNHGDLAAAATACAALQRLAPDHPATLQLAATVALRTGQAAVALDNARRALALRPGHVPSLLLAAQAARAAGLPAQALAPLRQAVQRAPDLAEAAFLLCHTLLDLADPSLEAAMAATARRHASAAPEWQRLGRALLRAGRPAAALAAFDHAANDPAAADAAYGRGLALRALGRLPPARAALQQAVACAPDAAGAWFALGLTCQDLRDEAAAAAAFAAALRARPDLAEAAVNLGIAHQRLDDLPAALDAYRQAIRIRPDTFARIAQAVTAARTGLLCLNLADLRRLLGA